MIRLHFCLFSFILLYFLLFSCKDNKKLSTANIFAMDIYGVLDCGFTIVCAEQYADRWIVILLYHIYHFLRCKKTHDMKYGITIILYHIVLAARNSHCYFCN